MVIHTTFSLFCTGDTAGILCAESVLELFRCWSDSEPAALVIQIPWYWSTENRFRKASNWTRGKLDSKSQGGSWTGAVSCACLRVYAPVYCSLSFPSPGLLFMCMCLETLHLSHHWGICCLCMCIAWAGCSCVIAGPAMQVQMRCFKLFGRWLRGSWPIGAKNSGLCRCVLHLCFAGVHVRLHVHVFGNYWLGGFKDRDPEPIRARDTILFYMRVRDTIHYNRRDTIHYNRRDTILYFIRARAAPGLGFSYMGHQLISALCILLISASLILTGPGSILILIILHLVWGYFVAGCLWLLSGHYIGKYWHGAALISARSVIYRLNIFNI